MPEGPEIWRTADRLSDALAEREVTDIRFTMDRLAKFEDRLTGRVITTVEPRGKALITRFENGLNIYSHNQLYGKWKVADRGGRPDTGRKLRIRIENDKHAAFLYSATDIEVIDDKALETHEYLRKLGPDVLHPDTGFAEVSERYRDRTYRNRKLTTLLLDQGFLSGIGNYLRSEILFEAGVHPDRKLRECSERQVEKLAGATLELARRSYETGGITTDPEVVTALKREGSKRGNYRHFVYGRGGERCHRCGTTVEVVKTGGRKVFFCPVCQPDEVPVG